MSPVPAVVIDACGRRDFEIRSSHDVCFGMLLMEAFCDGKNGPGVDNTSQTPVNITTSGSFLKLKFQNNGESAGSFVSQALTQLIRERLARLSGSLKAFKGRGEVFPGCGLQSRALYVTLYGNLADGDRVADILDEAGLFLQRPDESSYDRRVRYVNPMYLLPPGADMPGLGAFSNESTESASDQSGLGEQEKSRILRVFDEASGAVDGQGVQARQSPRIKSVLQHHQLEALAMMTEKEGTSTTTSTFPSLWEAFTTNDGAQVYRHVVTRTIQSLPLPRASGGILADEMGLGKTLSALALICSHIDAWEAIETFSSGQSPRHMSRATLIVAPLSLMYGWQKQIQNHIHPGGLRTVLYHGSKRQEYAQSLHEFDVVLTTYDTLRSDWGTYGPLYSSLTWSRIILDEAHKIRNSSAKMFDAVCQVPARNRWCLTGTPIHNSLDDFGSLLAFVGVPPFVTRDQFRFWVSQPILSYRDSQMQSLRRLVAATCLRRTKAQPRLAVMLQLPQKQERVEVVELSERERRLYEFFKRRCYLLAGRDTETGAGSNEKRPVSGSKSPSRGKSKATKRGKGCLSTPERNHGKRGAGNIVVVLMSTLRMICNHGPALLAQRALEAWQKHDDNFISWEVLETVAANTILQEQNCAVCTRSKSSDETTAETTDAEMSGLSCGRHFACEACVEGKESSSRDGVSHCPSCNNLKAPSPNGTASGAPSPFSTGLSQQYEPSSKVLAVLNNLFRSLDNDRRRKSLVFSQWTGMLDLFSTALSAHLEARGLMYVRIDGRSSLQQRRDALDRFNSDSSTVVMLASIGAVGEGVDLSAASDVHLIEPHWNPMAEAQAVDRVHRIGQKHDVTITRYITKDSIEEYIQWVQNDKLKLAAESLGEAKRTDSDLVDERWKKLMAFLE